MEKGEGTFFQTISFLWSKEKGSDARILLVEWTIPLVYKEPINVSQINVSVCTRSFVTWDLWQVQNMKGYKKKEQWTDTEIKHDRLEWYDEQ